MTWYKSARKHESEKIELKNLVRAMKTITTREPVTRKHRTQVRTLLGISHPAQRQQAQQPIKAQLCYPQVLCHADQRQ